MRPARLLLALLVTLVLASSANAAPSASAAARRTSTVSSSGPTSRSGTSSHARPSFAWAPVPGAVSYQLELATSSTFRENGLLYADRELKSPVASITLTLPWITGSPYSLYARVRAVFKNGATSWSKPFGFNMRQTEVPRPLASYPGLLRWTPIEGATAYDIWLIDIPKMVRIFGNVMDEREFYTFHQANPWMSKVRWRIRTVRSDQSQGGKVRANGLPVSSFGGWSPVYESVNPPFARRRAEGSRDRLRRRLEGPVVGPRAPVDACVRLRRQPGSRRRSIPSSTASTSSPTVTA